MTSAILARVRAPRPVASLGRRLGWSEGDLWTVGIGLALALLLAVTTIPAALDARSRTRPEPVTEPIVAAPPPAAAAALPPDAPVAAAPPAEPVTQEVLGPLAPVSPADRPEQPADADPPPPVEPGEAGPPPIPPNAVRVFAAIPGGGSPGAVAVGRDGAVSVGTDAPPGSGSGPARLFTWSPTGALRSTSDAPEQPAGRTRGLTALATLPDGSLVAADAATARILRFDPSGKRWSVLARLPDLASCLLPIETSCQPGINDTPPLPRGIAVDSEGAVYVADAGQGTIWRLTGGKQLEAWYQSADVAGEEGLAGLAIDAAGRLLVAVTRVGDLQGTGAGALMSIERAEDGTAGARTVVAPFRAGDDPVDVAVGTSGSYYVALRGAAAIVVVDRTGQESLRIVDDRLVEPTGLDLTTGRLVVAAGSRTPHVLLIGTTDRPAETK